MRSSGCYQKMMRTMVTDAKLNPPSFYCKAWRIWRLEPKWPTSEDVKSEVKNYFCQYIRLIKNHWPNIVLFWTYYECTFYFFILNSIMKGKSVKMYHLFLAPKSNLYRLQAIDIHMQRANNDWKGGVGGDWGWCGGLKGWNSHWHILRTFSVFLSENIWWLRNSF